MKKTGFFLIIVIIITTKITIAGSIDYNKKTFQEGETVYINLGDDIFNSKYLDENGYVYLEIIQEKLVKARLIKICFHYNTLPDIPSLWKDKTVWSEKDGDTAIVELEKKDDKDGKKTRLRRSIVSRFPQQSVLLLNW